VFRGVRIVHVLGLLRLYDYFYHKEHLFIVTELLRVRPQGARVQALCM
jgi:hypothetical protein